MKNYANQYKWKRRALKAAFVIGSFVTWLAIYIYAKAFSLLFQIDLFIDQKEWIINALSLLYKGERFTKEQLLNGLLILVVLIMSGILVYFIRGWIDNLAALWSFNTLKAELRNLKKKLYDRCRISVVKGVTDNDHLEKEENAINVSLKSSSAFLSMEVDPSGIQKCIEFHTKQLPDVIVTRLLACSTLKAKEWLNPLMIEYLLTTLALGSIAIRNGGTATRIFIVDGKTTDTFDKLIINHLDKVHRSIGFKFHLLPEGSQEKGNLLKEIESYQRNTEGQKKPDSAFLHVQFPSSSYLYRIESLKNKDYPKAWSEEVSTGDTVNQSVVEYEKVITRIRNEVELK